MHYPYPSDASSPCLLSVFVALAIAAETRVGLALDMFNPKQVTIRVGDTVKWTNNDCVPHTATSYVPEFDSAGSTFSHKLRPGTFNNYCKETPVTMIGTITVQ